MGDKLDGADKSTIEAAIQKVKDAIASNDVDNMKNATDELQQTFNNVAQKIYQQNPGAAQGFDPSQAAGGAAQGPDDNVVDADYTVVDDDNK